MRILLVCSWLQLVTPENETYDITLLVVTGFVILSRFLLLFVCVVIVLISLALYPTFCGRFDSNRKKVLVSGSTEATATGTVRTWYVVELCPQIHKITGE